MHQNPPHEDEPVRLTEWDYVTPAHNRRLEGISLKGDIARQRLAKSLCDRVDLREGYQGLEIASTSFVGRFDFGSLRIAIDPKLPALPLSTLLRYAYGLRDIGIVDETRAPTTRHGLHDLLIAMLVDEVAELLHRGLSRQYMSLSEELVCPRGKILIDVLINQGGIIKDRLPCQHFERNTNWHLNQVLRSGLNLAARMTADKLLRRRVLRLAGRFGDVQDINRFGIDDIDQAERALTRLTAANEAALTIIRLLTDMQGVAFETVEASSRTPGFLFDMNRFFQRLLSRFFSENLTATRILDERAISNVFAYSASVNPKGRSNPKPRPDFACIRDNRLCGFVDAKYRDIWEKGLPAEWLYQLSVYAMASPLQVSVLLYATMAVEARDEQIEIRQPVAWSNKGPACVIIRPVLLPKLANLLHSDRKHELSQERRQFADELVNLTTVSGGNREAQAA
jgi:5-methylcytosine-specific restriction enzyme subunit McrC